MEKSGCSPNAVLYWISATLGVLGMIPYAIANWVMASRYHTISVEMPFVLDDEPIPRSRCTKASKDFCAIVCNTLAALGYEGTNAWGVWKELKTEGDWEPTPGSLYFNATAASLLTFNFSLMVSGYVQIRAVLRVLSYFKDNDSPLNMKTLVLHATAFGLYIVTLLINSLVAVCT